MRKTGIAIAVIAAFGLSAGVTYGQQPGNARKQTKQTHDTGVDDEKVPVGSSPTALGARNVSEVRVTVHANGVTVAELSESYDEALVVRINPDGTRTYVEVRGADRAADVVHSEPAPAQAVPVLEEK